MRPCLERMIVTTAWVQAMDEDKTNEPSLSKRFHVYRSLVCILNLVRFKRREHLLQEGKLILLRILDFV